MKCHWDDCTMSVYFVDFLTSGREMSIFCYDFEEKVLYSSYNEGESSPIYLYPFKECNKHKDLFIVGLTNSTEIIEWNVKRSTVARVVDTIFNVQLENPDGRLVVGRVGPLGYFYVGTFTTRFCSGPANASFYRYTKPNGLQRIFAGVTTTTGIELDTSAKKNFIIWIRATI